MVEMYSHAPRSSQSVFKSPTCICDRNRHTAVVCFDGQPELLRVGIGTEIVDHHKQRAASRFHFLCWNAIQGQCVDFFGKRNK